MSEFKSNGLKEGKTQWHLLPMHLLLDTVKVLTMGATKYTPWNWTKITAERVYEREDSLKRHIVAYFDEGEQIDPESGLSHLGHMMCNLLFITYAEKYKGYKPRVMFKKNKAGD